MTLYETLASLVSMKDDRVQHVNLLLAKLHEFKLSKTPEGLAIWITASSLFSGLVFPKGVWNHNNPLSGKERTVVAKVLRDNSSPSEDDSNAAKNTGAAQTSPSFAWQVVLNKLYETNDNKGQEEFEKFWIEAVDSEFDAPW